MIVEISANVEGTERDGWTCAQLTGTYVVTRLDQSKREVTRDQLIALLKAEPTTAATVSDTCPKCGSVGAGPFHSDDDADNYLCTSGCGPFRVNLTTEPTDL